MAAFGSVTALTGGTATLDRAANQSGYQFVQNCDIAPLLVEFLAGGNVIGQVTLAAAASAGAPGGYLDSVNCPMFRAGGQVRLTSTVATGKIGSGACALPPNQ